MQYCVCCPNEPEHTTAPRLRRSQTSYPSILYIPKSSGAACSVNISGDSLCVTYRENEKKCISLGNRMSEDKWQHLYVTSSRLFNLFPVEPFASVINRHNKSPAVTLLLSWWTLRGMTPVWPLHLLAPTAQHISPMGFTRNHLQCE